MAQNPFTPSPPEGMPVRHETELAQAIKRHARELGFDVCRMAPVELAQRADFFGAWLAGGRAGEMAYLERNVDRRCNPKLLTPHDSQPLRTVIVLAVNYRQFEPPAALRSDPSRGLIASYAWSDDYHEVIRPLLHDLDAFIRRRTGRTTPGKCLVDTGPVLERDWAERAGVGFTGKNCCTIHPQMGSWLLLATVIVPERVHCARPEHPGDSTSFAKATPQAVMNGLRPDGRYGAWYIPLPGEEVPGGVNSKLGACGRCTRCLDACPTGAFVGPYHLDPRRCISYWTIESRQPIPRALRPSFGNRIFGCDICQDVCPWNRRPSPITPMQEGLMARQDRIAVPLLEGFTADTPYWLNDDAFRIHFRRSPLLRAKRGGMLRNVCVALGNWASPDAVPALSKALHDPEPLARGHAAWALGRINSIHGHVGAADLLSSALMHEEVEWVRAEIADACPGETPQT